MDFRIYWIQFSFFSWSVVRVFEKEKTVSKFSNFFHQSKAVLYAYEAKVLVRMINGCVLSTIDKRIIVGKESLLWSGRDDQRCWQSQFWWVAFSVLTQQGKLYFFRYGLKAASGDLCIMWLQVALYQHIADLAGVTKLVLPVPAFNIINGGSHAGNKLAMQVHIVVLAFSQFTMFRSLLWPRGMNSLSLFGFVTSNRPFWWIVKETCVRIMEGVKTSIRGVGDGVKSGSGSGSGHLFKRKFSESTGSYLIKRVGAKLNVQL